MELKDYHILIVGAGFYGAVMAERIANDLHKKVLLIDKREHIGGNCFSYNDEQTGINVHKYGSHIFHTSNEKVWNYLNQFSKFNNYQHKVFTQYKDQILSMPINLTTINDFFGKSFNPEQAQIFLQEKMIPLSKIGETNLETTAISKIGVELYEALIKGYTEKQWQTNPTELPAKIINRLPVRFDKNQLYFSDKFQGIPCDGYTPIFEKMLQSPLIDIQLGVDYFEMKKEIPNTLPIIYTGPIDKFFNYKHGKLGWRTVEFEISHYDQQFFQKNSVINYAEKSVPYTRIHEFKHYHPEKEELYQQSKTITFKEYSIKTSQNVDPYYPINSAQDVKMYNRYKEESLLLNNTHFGGRLGQYLYLDMHQVVAQALTHYENVIKAKFAD